LLVAADGGDSRVRKLLGVGTDIRDYQQSAVSANVRPQSPHRGVAFERFTDSGPLALLPFDTLCCTAIWTHSNTVAEELALLPDTEFLRRMQEAFGYRLGRFLEVGRRSVFPLHLVQAREQVHGRSVLIGNAAHTLHPVAGQGFNLGLRDAASLAGILAEVARLGGDPGAQATLQRYRHARRWDQGLVVRATDSLARLFVHDSGVLDAACALGMKALDLLPPLKHGFARYAMGLSAR
jgi:2-octaprenyl-6-methoxyphenol hydroxylase